jgi:hypothetical protein
MIQRCTNPNHTYYKNYGERKITVCKRWMKFENFLKDMGECPKGLFLDRIDNGKGYYKENCRWTTRKINNTNKRNNRNYILDKKICCLKDIAKKYNIPYSTLKNRLNRGISIEEALINPIK